ncbi:MAG TPA: hypothetical protein VFI40_03005 [Nocardioides sp.]|nr:hypothetical protein [Nocardioides sp.]
MKAVLVLLLLVIGAMGAWSMLDPRSAFRATQGRMFRNPSAVHLSGSAVAVQRLIGAVVLVVAIIALVNL